jgi:tetratricopeptide (TPR) repeat protein
MDIDLAQQSIAAALEGSWEKAVTLNKEILKEDNKNVDALNRLARALSELGEISKAKKIAQQVIDLDPSNSIAIKALKKWTGIKSGDVIPSKTSSPEVFLEEPGKTKMVSLLHLGCMSVIGKLDSGDEVMINDHCHRVAITTMDGKYIGRLPDDLSARLKKLISLGNVYKSYIKSIDPENVEVFLREVQRGKKAGDTASFFPEKIDYVSYTPPELVRKKEVLVPTQAEES